MFFFASRKNRTDRGLSGDFPRKIKFKELTTNISVLIFRSSESTRKTFEIDSLSKEKLLMLLAVNGFKQTLKLIIQREFSNSKIAVSCQIMLTSFGHTGGFVITKQEFNWTSIHPNFKNYWRETGFKNPKGFENTF